MRRSANLAVLSVLLAAAACESQPAAVLTSGLQLTSGFAELQPSTIAILPIEDGTADGAFGAIAERMRTSMESELADRAYAPLAPRYVDDKLTAIGKAGTGSPVDTAWLGGVRNAFQEEAVLGIRVTSWDSRRVVESGRVQFRLQVLMLDSSTGAVLWSGPLEGSVKAGGEGPSPIARDQRIESAAAVLGVELVRKLPIRQPR